jgi:hypothetical protein
MRQVYWVLLLGPPILGTLGWAMTCARTSAIMGGRTTPRILAWQKYDFWIILALMYVVMFAAAFIEHKL